VQKLLAIAGGAPNAVSEAAKQTLANNQTVTQIQDAAKGHPELVAVADNLIQHDRWVVYIKSGNDNSELNGSRSWFR
jgi:hypothetical protein